MDEGYDYHFLVLAPGLPAIWFLQAARQYWLAFQPIVTDDWKLVNRAPDDAYVAVTLLANTDNINLMRKQMGQRRDNLKLDVLVAPDLTKMEAYLNQRARRGLPFG